jgi:subtilisin family serine protease
LGELVAINNYYGVTGIAYGAAAKFASPCPTAGTCTGYNPADAINAARLNTQKGDVILLEQQVAVCGLGERKYGPIEWYQDIFEAIKLATADGRIVVEAAGNGSVNLDQQACEGRFNRTVRNSGAIIVGAGAPPNFTQEDRSRLSFSSYGSRVDLQGWGEWVTTAGYKDLYQGSGKNEWYTEVFSGTSSASPIVAGAAALLSSAAKDRGTVLTPDRVRTILVNSGCLQQYSLGFPVTERIGPRPNLRAAIGRLPAPAVAATPGALHFRSPRKGAPLSSQTVTVRNRGDRETTLIIEEIAVTGPNAFEFFVDRGTCKDPLGPGKTCTMSVSFSPASSGSKSASLTIFSNDPKRPQVIVPLSGNGATAAER